MSDTDRSVSYCRFAVMGSGDAEGRVMVGGDPQRKRIHKTVGVDLEIWISIFVAFLSFLSILVEE
jgi:hypothetical protein